MTVIGVEMRHCPHFCSNIEVETIQIFQTHIKGGSKWRSICGNLHIASALPGIWGCLLLPYTGTQSTLLCTSCVLRDLWFSCPLRLYSNLFCSMRFPYFQNIWDFFPPLLAISSVVCSTFSLSFSSSSYPNVFYCTVLGSPLFIRNRACFPNLSSILYATPLAST